jgi:catechol 2,3-dioxygenase-like lactoylglutathione lyase family enzyme
LLCGVQGLDLFEVAENFEVGREMNHMAINVAADDIDEVCAALDAAGVEHSEPTHRHTVFVADPDGHRLEILPLAAKERSRERAAAAAGQHA